MKSMRDELKLSSQQLNEYLQRIGFEDERALTKEALDELVYLHQCSIPFETIDMHHCEKPPLIELEEVFNKLVVKKRGGYCYELNFLFEALLANYGFIVRPIMCRAVRGRPGRMPINHRGILVDLENVIYFVDVGFGGPLAAGAIKLDDGLTQTIRGEVYTPRKIDNCWWAVERKTRAKADLYGDDVGERVQIEIELCMAKVEDVDFEALNMHAARPGYLFAETYIANIRTDKGFKGLRDNILTIRENNTVEKRELLDEDDFAEALEVHFGFTP